MAITPSIMIKRDITASPARKVVHTFAPKALDGTALTLTGFDDAKLSAACDASGYPDSVTLDIVAVPSTNEVQIPLSTSNATAIAAKLGGLSGPYTLTVGDGTNYIELASGNLKVLLNETQSFIDPN